MFRGHHSGACCSDTSPRVSPYFYFRATRILLQFCPRDMSHQLVELCRTCQCRDKTLQGWKCPFVCIAEMSLRVHCCATRSCNRISISANRRPEFFALFDWGKNNMAAMDCGVRYDWDRKGKLIIALMMLMG